MINGIFSEDRLCVDLRGRVMKYALIRRGGNRKAEIRRYGSLEFSPEHTEGGTLKDNEETVRVITGFLKKEGIASRKLYINISDPSVVVRLVKVPKMESRDLGDYLKMEISQYLPVDLEANAYDYKILNEVEEEGRKLLNVLLTSVSRDLIQGYIRLFKKAGLNPELIDVYPNSISRVFGVEKESDTAVIDVNGNSVDFVILESGKLFMYSNVFTETLYSFENPEEKDMDELLEDNVAFAATFNEIINYARTYLNYFSARHFGKSVDVVYLTGRPALIKDIEAYLGELLQLKVAAGLPEGYRIEPVKDVTQYRKNLNINKILADYTGCLGLALRGD